MAIAVHLGQSPESDNERGAARRSLLLEARGAFENGLETNVLVYNASATGLLVESRIRIAGEVGTTPDKIRIAIEL